MEQKTTFVLAFVPRRSCSEINELELNFDVLRRLRADRSLLVLAKD